MEAADRILLQLPCKAEYVSVARLAVSGIAGRIGFDIETIEDIKVAVSEVCSKIIGVLSGFTEDYEIMFDASETGLAVTFASRSDKIRCIFDDDTDGVSLSIIKAFMDKVEFCPDNENYILTMIKNLERNSGDGR